MQGGHFYLQLRNLVLNTKCVYFKDQRNLDMSNGLGQCLFVYRACLWEGLYAREMATVQEKSDIRELYLGATEVLTRKVGLGSPVT